MLNVGGRVGFLARPFAAAIVSVLVVAAWPTGARAGKLTYDDILGDWCGEVWNYNFTRDRLTVTYRDERAPRVMKIRRYEFAGEWISVRFRPRGGSVFAEFGLDGRNMVQQPDRLGDSEPRRPFRRC